MTYLENKIIDSNIEIGNKLKLLLFVDKLPKKDDFIRLYDNKVMCIILQIIGIVCIIDYLVK